MRFRKKPVIVDAVLWRPDPDIGTGYDKHGVEYTVTQHTLQTRQGPMRVDEGDWIITQEDGEKYPCKPDVFDKHYEEIPKRCPSCGVNKPVETHHHFLCKRCITQP